MKDTTTNTTFSIYLLYPIDRDDEGNFYKLLQEYINIGTEIYAYLLDWEKMDGLPKFRLYVPADHEVFIHSAYKSGFISKEQITCINCKIIETCDLLILYDGYEFEGYSTLTPHRMVEEELSCAKQENIAVYNMPSLDSIAIQALKLAIEFIIRSKD